LKIDEWDVDAAYSASQKGLGAPSGLAPITMGTRAKDKIENRKSPVSSYMLPPLTTAQVPSGVDPHQVRARLLNEYNIEIAAGFGTLKDKVWRIGLMGYSSRKENVTLLLGALRELLK
jgi:aspartate aminotransferase-like enzyme